MSQEDGPTPGLEPVITITLGSSQMRARRPSRGDDAEITRRYVAKLIAAAPAIADAALIDVARMTLDHYDGANLFAEAQFEVLLVPRRYTDGSTTEFGESAPDHWFRSVKGVGGQDGIRVVSFDRVPPREFDRAREQLADALVEKKSVDDLVPSSSTDTAPTQTSG